MAYTRFNDPWANADSATGGGDESTPITAAALDHIEDGIFDAAATADAAIPESIVDAKGDLIVATAADTVARLAVGADNEVPAASAGAAGGIVWRKIGNAMIATDAAIAASKLAGYPNDATKALLGDGSWGTVSTTISAVTALPGSPANGDKVIFVDSLTAPTYQWLLQYISGISGSNKWVFIGGTRILSYVATDEATSSTAYVDLSTAGPSVTVPLAGSYEVRMEANPWITAAAAMSAFMTVKVGAAAAGDTQGVGSWFSSGGAMPQYLHRTQAIAAAASDALKVQYRCSNSGGSIHFLNRLMSVVPIAVR